MRAIIEIAILAIVAVLAVKIVYVMLPYRRWRARRPKFALFPKYSTEFNGTYDDLVDSLKKHGFEEADEATYVRGKLLGDFSANALRLKVITNKSNNQFTVAASFWGLLFDTGDLWQVTADIANH